MWEDSDWVYASYVDASGDLRTVRGKFLVGADGKTGFTRKQYLEPRGVTLEREASAPYDKVWVALNWRISFPTPETHPEFPLWDKGFTPEQVYDEFFPKNFRFLCNPTRPAVCGRFGLESDRLWRFEFVVLQGEDPTEMASQASIIKVVHPYITHPGSRYGIPQKEVVFPLDSVNHAAGQELVEYHELFRGWYSERKQQLEQSLRATVENGDYVTESSAVKIMIRDWYLWAIQLIPSWKHWLHLGHRREGMTSYKWVDGKDMAFVPALGGGVNFPQVYAKRIVDKETRDEPVHFTDDLIFAPDKVGMFQLVILLNKIDDQDQILCRGELERLREMSGGHLREDEVTVFLNSTQSGLGGAIAGTVYRLATADEFAQDPVLCANRPYPTGYDAFRMAREVGSRKFVVLRPDRFVFAATNTAVELHAVARMLREFAETGTLR
ncbi:hypothetical protein JDV02_002473 [Purpureocillium takamizusanense]|uniref:Uncharacterized protein n=1 Tax=Purpureocillium takamizusanense TaxID=2060973 RepID=A0A9Q8V7S0_9HYPO|nr:uncharacterized protein JDV02_002473 [Purpureocillium takamizusanense]UNI15993.1 hypothetical protein JDV02_002473 [Purpureocillium takamizusanense]